MGESHSELISRIWPQWTVTEKIGQGSFGVVYKAERTNKSSITAAIKVICIPSDNAEVESLREEGMTIDDTKQYFNSLVDECVNEIELMEKFKGHTNIVSIEDFEVIPNTDGIGAVILVRMELLEPFGKKYMNSEIPENDVVKLGTDICSALEICQQENVIHRDIKPDNIFISKYGDFKLGDFGIAKKLESMNASHSQKGTMNYIAPEVASGTHYDARVDIYSLGLVMYRLLNNNCLPFLSENTRINPQARKDAMDRRLGGEALPKPCNASEKLADIVLKACAFNPDSRFKNVTEMKNALVSFAGGAAETGKSAEKEYVPDATVSAAVPVKKEKKKSRLPLFIGLGAAVIAIVAAVLVITLRKPAANENNDDERTSSVTSEPKENATEKPVVNPTEIPTAVPADNPTEKPTDVPTEKPTDVPTEKPTSTPEPTPTPTPAVTPKPTPHVEKKVVSTIKKEIVGQNSSAKALVYEEYDYDAGTVSFGLISADGKNDTGCIYLGLKAIKDDLFIAELPDEKYTIIDYTGKSVLDKDYDYYDTVGEYGADYRYFLLVETTGITEDTDKAVLYNQKDDGTMTYYTANLKVYDIEKRAFVSGMIFDRYVDISARGDIIVIYDEDYSYYLPDGSKLDESYAVLKDGNVLYDSRGISLIKSSDGKMIYSYNSDDFEMYSYSYCDNYSVPGNYPPYSFYLFRGLEDSYRKYVVNSDGKQSATFNVSSLYCETGLIITDESKVYSFDGELYAENIGKIYGIRYYNADTELFVVQTEGDGSEENPYFYYIYRKNVRLAKCADLNYNDTGFSFTSDSLSIKDFKGYFTKKYSEIFSEFAVFVRNSKGTNDLFGMHGEGFILKGYRDYAMLDFDWKTKKMTILAKADYDDWDVIELTFEGLE